MESSKAVSPFFFVSEVGVRNARLPLGQKHAVLSQSLQQTHSAAPFAKSPFIPQYWTHTVWCTLREFLSSKENIFLWVLDFHVKCKGYSILGLGVHLSLTFRYLPSPFCPYLQMVWLQENRPIVSGNMRKKFFFFTSLTAFKIDLLFLFERHSYEERRDGKIGLPSTSSLLKFLRYLELCQSEIRSCNLLWVSHKGTGA